MILGQDTTKREKPTVNPKTVTIFLDYFNHQARQHGAVVVSGADIPLFRAHIKRLLNSGVSMETMRWNARTFFNAERFRSHPCPWKMFVSKRVQAGLMQGNVEAKVVSVDPVLSWILSDFTDVDELPWDRSYDLAYRIVVLRYTDALYTYPDVVADVVSKYTPRLSANILTLIEELLDDCLDPQDRKVIQSKLQQYEVTVPRGLLTGRVKRGRATTLAEAVSTLQR